LKRKTRVHRADSGDIHVQPNTTWGISGEIVCLDETGQKVIVTEWAVGSSDGKHCTKEHRLEDGSPVTSLGGSYEHFYTGKMFRPL
jgi:hypothetical protein